MSCLLINYFIGNFFINDISIISNMISIFILIVYIIKSRLSIKYKIIFFALIYSIFKFYLSMMFFIFRISYITTSYKFKCRKDDSLVRNITTKFFKENFRFIQNYWKLPNYPTIIVANYTNDRFENFAGITIPKNIAFIMAEGMVKIAKLDKALKYCIVKKKNGNEYNEIKEEIYKYIKNGISVFAYVSSFSYMKGKISKLRTGLFRIAKELNIDITPIAIDYIDTVYGIIPNQNFRICVGETFKPTEIYNDIFEVRKFLKEKIIYFKNNK